MTRVAVAYIVFNRPQHTAKTFSVLREQRPSKLFIIADGPRPGNSADVANCAAVREIVSRVDWPCEVHRNYASENLGLKRRISSGLNWVFSFEDRAIVLEDDCVAHPDFFVFCESLLERYERDDRVWVVTGNNFQAGQRRGDAAYYFSKYNHCWGWATWRRAWTQYQGDIQFWETWKYSDDWEIKMVDSVERRYWRKIFDRVHGGEIDSWAYPWTASVWYGGGLTATPNVNLVTNIGFGADATHTTSGDSKIANLPIGNLGTLAHPDEVVQDFDADRYAFDHAFGGRNLRWPRSLLFLPRRVGGYIYRKFSESVAQ